MNFRIYIDESGTHSSDWLIIGMLFVPEHGVLHAELCDVKDRHSYFNRSPKSSLRPHPNWSSRSAQAVHPRRPIRSISP